MTHRGPNPTLHDRVADAIGSYGAVKSAVVIALVMAVCVVASARLALFLFIGVPVACILMAMVDTFAKNRARGIALFGFQVPTSEEVSASALAVFLPIISISVGASLGHMLRELLQ